MSFYAFFGGGVNVYDTSDKVSQAVEKGEGLVDATKRLGTERPGGKFTDASQYKLIDKKYRAYSKYGPRNKDVARLLSVGVSNRDKAEYLADRVIEARNNPEVKMPPVSSMMADGLISKELKELLDGMLKKRASEIKTK
jgi:hypothetical protein